MALIAWGAISDTVASTVSANTSQREVLRRVEQSEGTDILAETFFVGGASQIVF